MDREPSDLTRQAARNAELRRLFAKPTVRLTDEDSPGVFAIHVIDQRTKDERLVDRIPAEPLGRLLACLPDGAGADGIELAVCCYRIGVASGRAAGG
jgi:hypothetical protein